MKQPLLIAILSFSCLSAFAERQPDYGCTAVVVEDDTLPGNPAYDIERIPGGRYVAIQDKGYGNEWRTTLYPTQKGTWENKYGDMAFSLTLDVVPTFQVRDGFTTYFFNCEEKK